MDRPFARHYRAGKDGHEYECDGQAVREPATLQRGGL